MRMCPYGNATQGHFHGSPDFRQKNLVKKVLLGRLYQDAIRGHLMRIRRPGKNLGHGTEKKRTGSPMLAKRIIVAAFAALAIGLLPLALPGERELFVDVNPAPQALAAN